MMHSQSAFALDILPEAAMSAELDEAIRRLLCQCFPADREAFSKSRPWHQSVPEFTVLHRREGAIEGHVAVVVRRIRCGSLPVVVAGIQSLCVVPAKRKTGLSVALMRRAMEEATRRGIHFGLLFCLPDLERFYKRLGWFRIDTPVTMTDPSTGQQVPIPAKNITMAAQLADKPFPPGPIHLEGPDW